MGGGGFGRGNGRRRCGAFYHAFRTTPAFYVAALPLPAGQVEAWGKELEREVAQLHNDVQAGGRWQLILTDQQINGWLIDDLPQKFPTAVPATCSSPVSSFNRERSCLLVSWKTPCSRRSYHWRWSPI